MDEVNDGCAAFGNDPNSQPDELRLAIPSGSESSTCVEKASPTAESCLVALVDSEDISRDEKIAGLEMISKILNNICREPSNIKFLTLKKSNNVVQRSILLEGRPAASLFADILRSVGFEETDEVFHLPITTDGLLVNENLISTARDLVVGIAASLRFANASQLPNRDVRPESETTDAPSSGQLPPTEKHTAENVLLAKQLDTADSATSSSASPSSADTQRSGITDQSPSRGGATNLSTSSFRRHPREEHFQKKNQEIEEMRRIRAEQYAAKRGGVSDGEPLVGQRDTGSSSGSGRLRGLFSAVFGSSGSSPRRDETRRPNNIKTMKDLPKPPPPRGGG